MLEQSCENPNNTQVGDTADRFLKCCFMMNEEVFLCAKPQAWSISEVEPLLQRVRIQVQHSRKHWPTLLSVHRAAEERLRQLRAAEERLQQLRLPFRTALLAWLGSAFPGLPQHTDSACCIHSSMWVMCWPGGTFHRAIPSRATHHLSSVTPTTSEASAGPAHLLNLH